MVIGLSVGISLAVVAAIAAFGALLFRWRPWQKPQPQQDHYPEMLDDSGLANSAPNELPGRMGVSELMAVKPGNGAHELDTKRAH